MTNQPPNSQGPSPEDLMAYERAIRGLSPEMQRQIQKATQLGLSFESLVGFAESFANQLEHASSYLEEQRKDLTKSLSLYADLNGKLKDTLDTSSQFRDNLSNNLKIQRDFGSVLSEETQLLDDVLLKQNMISTGLRGQYAQLLTTFMIENEISELDNDRVKALIQELTLRQHASEHLEDQRDLVEEIAKYELEAREEVEKYTKGWQKTKALLLSVVSDPKLSKTIFTGLAIKKVTEAVKEMGTEIGELRKGGESVTQAFHSLGQTLSFNSIVLGQDTKGALEGLQSSMGDLHSISTDTVKTTAAMSQAFGVSTAEAGELVGNMSHLAGMSQESAANMGLMTGRLAVSAGVKPGKVLADMAKNSEAMAKFSAKGGESFMRAAVGAAKMGIEVSKLASATEGLLDFENSINKQMEASVLLGREINLDKARELALNGDIAGATAEMLKNVGGEAEFNKMNVLQRKALAESMGMSVEDLGKMVKHQNEFTEAQTLALQQGMKLDEVLAMGGGAMSKLTGLFTKENLMLMFTAMNAFKGTGGVFTAMGAGFKSAKEAGAGLFKSMGAGIKGMFGGGKVPEVKTDVLDKTNKVKGGGGFKAAMEGLAGGLKEMAGAKVRQGIWNTALAGPAMILGIAATPFMAVASMLGVSAGIGLIGLSEGLKGKGMGAALIGKGIANLALFGLASIPAVLGLPFLIGVALTGQLAGWGMKGLAEGLKAMAKVDIKGILVLGLLGAALIPAALAFMMLKDVPVENMITFSIAVPLLGLAAAGLGFLAGPIVLGSVALAALGIGMIALGAGLMVLQQGKDGLDAFERFLLMVAKNGISAGIGLFALGGSLGVFALAAYSAFPGVMLIATGFAMLAPPMAIVTAIAQTGGLQILSAGLTALSQASAGLSDLAMSMMGLGGGLGMMAFSGMLAMPVILSLIALGAVAPALSGLGASLGGLFGGGGGEKEDKMDELITEIRELKAVMSKGGVVTMDAKKVGEVLRLSGYNQSSVK